MEPKGMLDLQNLKDKVANEEVETVIVAFTDHYGRLVGKRFDAEFFVENAAHEGTHQQGVGSSGVGRTNV